MKKELIDQLSSVIVNGHVRMNEPMSAHTTFKTGGVADVFVEPSGIEELKETLKLLQGESFYLIGNGSNLLVSDDGLRGVALHLAAGFGDITVKENTLICGAAATLSQIARTALDNALSGFEFAAGIPGSLGGAIVMNAGAYDGEMKQVVKRVKLMNYAGEIVEKDAEEMQFSYRHSILKEQQWIVLEAVIALEAGDKRKIKEKMDELAQKRREKQPLEYPSAGSTFKRPKGYFAAKLIEDAGLKGFRIGGAQVSSKHAGFVINEHNATSADIYALIKEIQRRVEENAGVAIETEVICLGKF
ncbi:MAG: UDP-N-acetylmuramate dehydrogenase [Lachnospiraceae bacterium]|nr:UDP-N-acetylmuramate dehydrogenase [Lachnospiraceae bacterium]